MSETATAPPKDCRAVLEKYGADALRAAAIDAEPFEAEAPEPEPEPQAEPERDPPPQAEAGPSFYYDGTRYHLDTGREFVPMDCRSVTRHLIGQGVEGKEISAVLCRIQTEGFIHYAGPLAGLPRGLHEMGGHKLLATAGPVIIATRRGEWPTLRAVLEGLLADDEAGDVQTTVFLAWLKFARESLVTGRRRPGQALALAGPRNCGKSLLIDILEAALGGRRANPYPFFTGRTNFNVSGPEQNRTETVQNRTGRRNKTGFLRLAAAIDW